jgi:hypothetical protein
MGCSGSLGLRATRDNNACIVYYFFKLSSVNDLKKFPLFLCRAGFYEQKIESGSPVYNSHLAQTPLNDLLFENPLLTKICASRQKNYLETFLLVCARWSLKSFAALTYKGNNFHFSLSNKNKPPFR